MTGALADTHVLLWWLADDERLSGPVRDLIAAGRVPVSVSAASVWEIAIKVETGRLTVPGEYLDALRADGFGELPITAPHARAAGALPMVHRDPFDRMLVAQAQVEGLTLLTRDRRIAAYDVPVLW